MFAHGGGTGSGGKSQASTITSTEPLTSSGESSLPRPEKTIPAIRGELGSSHGASAPFRSGFRYWPPTALGEVDVTPRRLDVAQQLVLPHRLPVPDGRHDVPVAEGAPAAARDDRERAAALEVRRPGLDRVHRRPVPGRDVDPEWVAREEPEMRGSLK